MSPLWDMHPPLDPSQVPIKEGSTPAGVHQLDWTMVATIPSLGRPLPIHQHSFETLRPSTIKKTSIRMAADPAVLNKQAFSITKHR